MLVKKATVVGDKRIDLLKWPNVCEYCDKHDAARELFGA
jgi:hypothetical protein